MRRTLAVTNGLILAAIAWMLNLSDGNQPSVLLPKRSLGIQGPDISTLESQAARAPTVSNIVALASAYLDREQSGLASAAIQRAGDIRQQPILAQLYARALFQRGRPREALALSRDVLRGCDALDTTACPTWLVAKMTRHVAFLEALEAAGIDDPLADPSATRAAYERSARDVRLVAMR